MADSKKSTGREWMIVNDVPGEECRIAILRDNHLDELYAEQTATATNVGNIYKGRVTKVEPSIQAAFVDFGKPQSGFLHITDLHPKYFPQPEQSERVGHKTPRRERPLIQNALKRGQEILVQVLKEGIGTKGPTLTSYLSIPGRMIVMMPGMDRVGVTRKIEDLEQRREMRDLLAQMELPDGFGFILRTAGVGKAKTELKRDVAYLVRLWKAMEKRMSSVGAPCELYTETDLLTRTIRDVLRPSIDAILVDSQSGFERAQSFLNVVAPRSAPRLVRYRRPMPIFHAFDIERQIELIHSREVPLPAGGALVIEQTEALVAIDVNSGKSKGAMNSETNAYQTNAEAVDEICRQLRLRDLGGLIINDLIDMRVSKNRRAIEDRIRENLKRDRAKTTVLRISNFGVLEMTRQRMRPSLRRAHFMPCPNCEGHGEVKMPESVGADALRHISFLLQFERVARIEMVCSPRVASVLLSSKRRELVGLEDSTGKTIDVRVSNAIAADRVDFYAYDDRSADIEIERLALEPAPRLDQLEKDQEPVVQSRADEQATKKRRRRRKPAPADAFEIAMQGLDDEEDFDDGAQEVAAEEAETPRKRRRRGRRGGRGRRKPVEASGEQIQQQTPVDEARESQTSSTEQPRRVYELARELEITSKDILEKCEDVEEIKLKNHMSTLDPGAVQQVREWFDESASSGATEESSQEQKSGRRRRSRRRRGRGGKQQSAGDMQAAQIDQPVTLDANQESDDGSGEQKGRRRRSRRRGRKKDESDGAGTDAGMRDDNTANALPNDASTGELSTKKKTGRRRRGKKKPDEAAEKANESPSDAVQSPSAPKAAGNSDIIVTIINDDDQANGVTRSVKRTGDDEAKESVSKKRSRRRKPAAKKTGAKPSLPEPSR